MSQLVNEISSNFLNLTFWKEVDPVLFANNKDKLVRNIKGWFKERPDTQCDTLLTYLMQQGSWLPEDRLKAAQDINVDSFLNRVQGIFKPKSVVSYSHGDIDQENAVSIHKTILRNLETCQTDSDLKFDGKQKEKEEFDYFKPKLLEKGKHTVVSMPVFNPEDSNNALLCYMQVRGACLIYIYIYIIIYILIYSVHYTIIILYAKADKVSPENIAKLILIRQLLSEPLFNELRTKQQLVCI